MTYNIQYGRGKDGRFDLARIAGEVEGADLIALQEVERHWSRSGEVDQPAVLADLLGEYHWAYGPGVDLDAGRGGPGGRPEHRRRQFGNMLLSRRPILTVRNHLLPKSASLGPMSLQRSALEGVIDTMAGPLRCYSVHLTHLTAQTRLRQIEALLDIHRRATEEGEPVMGAEVKEEWLLDGRPPPMPSDALVCGDFNAAPDSEEYSRMTGPTSAYGGRVLSPRRFADAWTAAGHEEAEGITADIRGRAVRLDYCFVSAGLASRIRGARIDADAQGSDHQPVWVDIDL